jgi:hypothetical protein
MYWPALFDFSNLHRSRVRSIDRSVWVFSVRFGSVCTRPNLSIVRSSNKSARKTCHKCTAFVHGFLVLLACENGATGSCENGATDIGVEARAGARLIKIIVAL